MRDVVERLIELWFQPLPPEEVAGTKFRELYHDPVMVNGAPLAAGISWHERELSRPRSVSLTFTSMSASKRATSS
jgi:hypothetical protein